MSDALLQELLDLSGDGPHPTRDAYLESALLHAWRKGELFTAGQVEAAVNRALDEARLRICELVDAAKRANLEDRKEGLRDAINVIDRIVADPVAVKWVVKGG